MNICAKFYNGPQTPADAVPTQQEPQHNQMRENKSNPREMLLDLAFSATHTEILAIIGNKKSGNIFLMILI